MTKELITLGINEIQPYERNPRRNDAAVDDLVESIKQTGYIAPIIVDENNVILAGHTRYKALQKIGKADALVMKVTGMTEAQKRKYRLLDNKVAEKSGWDYELLDWELEDIDFEGYDFGFDTIEDEPQEVTEDEPPEVDETKEPRTKLGNLWQLGNHRLICGDSTDSAVIDRLMDGVKADMVLSDPPYGMSLDTDF